ncbi:MAG: putative hydrolase of the HAD superfamily [Gammaproteobacteria bacterium]|jgi:putative hydrolase of the HAD superfamily
MPVIQHAEETLYTWLDQHYPRITANHDPQQLVDLRKQFTAQDKKYSVDLSMMRYEFLKKLATDNQYDVGEVADKGFDVFYNARQQVNFYDDVFPALERLSLKYRLGAITNGNANVEKVGLGHLMEHTISAIDLQIAKPDKRIYHALADRFDVPTEQILYIGDHPEYDVIGPQVAGLRAAWINREDHQWPPSLPLPKYQITNLYDLEALLKNH